MSLVFDEFGRPYIVLRDQEKKSRLKGIDAQKANILAARLVSNVVRTSLGPKGKGTVLRPDFLNHIVYFPWEVLAICNIAHVW